MAKYKQEYAGEDGWSRNVAPKMKGYKLGCCDCGLVHDVDFKVVKIDIKNEDGSWEASDVEDDDYRVVMRVRRNNRATGQVRRHNKNND
jgi:hypothetical protein